MFFGKGNFASNEAVNAEVFTAIRENEKYIASLEVPADSKKLIELHDIPENLQEIVKKPEVVAQYLIEKGRDFLTRVDYRKLLLESDNRFAAGDAERMALLHAVALDDGDFSEIGKDIVAITEAASPSQVFGHLVHAVSLFATLESVSAGYLLEAPVVIEPIERDYDDLSARSMNVHLLFCRITEYAGIIGEHIDLGPIRADNILFSQKNWKQNPILEQVLIEIFEKTEQRYASMGFSPNDLEMPENRDELLNDVKRVVLIAPALAATSTDEQEMKLANALSDYPGMMRHAAYGCFTLNRLTVDIAKAIQPERVVEIEELLARQFPHETEASAREFLEDKTHALRLYALRSSFVTAAQRKAINYIIYMHENEVTGTAAELIARARALRYSLECTPVKIPRHKFQTEVIPLNMRKLSDAKWYKYLDVEKIQRYLINAVSVVQLPFPELCRRIDIVPHTVPIDNSFRRSRHTISSIKKDDYESVTELQHETFAWFILHEMGRILLNQMTYEQFREYAEIFEREQQSGGRPYISDNSHTAYEKDQTEGIATDFCESVVLFAFGAEYHAAFRNASPERYEFLVKLMKSYMLAEAHEHYDRKLAQFMPENSHELALRPTNVIEKKKKDENHLSSSSNTVFSFVKNPQRNVLPAMIRLFMPGIRVV